ncbi:hypothetical protein ACFLUO_04195 [Chloroflexota bacterium]
MKKGLKLLGLGVGVVAIMALTLGGTVFADTPEETDAQACGAGWGGWQGGATCSETVGDLLGLTHEEIEAQRHEGKSMVEIAAAQGVTEDTLVEAILAAKQEQSDRMFQQMEQRTIDAVNRTDVGPVGTHEDRGAGAMRYGGNQNSQETCDGTELGTGRGMWGRGMR